MSKTMITRAGLVAAALAGLLTATTTLGAQTTDNTTASDPNLLWACYVPNSGTVYRVRESDTKQDCASPQHVMFSWNKQGIQGPPGIQGEKGDKGDAGPQGPKGDAGPAGEKGADGAPGAPGAPGAKGADGQPGPAGPQGAAGPAGKDGHDGSPGAPGPIGMTGPQGPQGPAGVSGFRYVVSATPAMCDATIIGAGPRPCKISIVCPSGLRPFSWGWEVTNLKAQTDVRSVGAALNSAGDGFNVVIENSSIIENTEWVATLICANAS